MAFKYKGDPRYGKDLMVPELSDFKPIYGYNDGFGVLSAEQQYMDAIAAFERDHPFDPTSVGPGPAPADTRDPTIVALETSLKEQREATARQNEAFMLQLQQQAEAGRTAQEAFDKQAAAQQASMLATQQRNDAAIAAQKKQAEDQAMALRKAQQRQAGDGAGTAVGQAVGGTGTGGTLLTRSRSDDDKNKLGRASLLGA